MQFFQLNSQPIYSFSTHSNEHKKWFTLLRAVKPLINETQHLRASFIRRCIYIYVDAFACACSKCKCTNTHTHTHVHVCMCASLHVCMFTCTRIINSYSNYISEPLWSIHWIGNCFSTPMPASFHLTHKHTCAHSSSFHFDSFAPTGPEFLARNGLWLHLYQSNLSCVSIKRPSGFIVRV